MSALRASLPWACWGRSGAAPPGAALRKFEEGSRAFAGGHYDAALKAFWPAWS